MEEKDTEFLGNYKEKVEPVTKGRVIWEKDLIFKGLTQRGYDIDFDAQIEWGCAPTESLLLSLGGCMAIDMVSMLQKMRVDLKSFKIELTGTRNPTPPQYFKSVIMKLILSGNNLDETKINRAVNLSKGKYCSVFNSLREDLTLDVQTVIEDR